MADTAAAPAFDWMATQRRLQPLVPGISVSEKIICRPTFRFLHDVIVYFHQQTRCFGGDGVFSAEDLDPTAAGAGKETKVAFLEKCVRAMEAQLRRPMSVNPKKVVAGADVEKTNAWILEMCALVEGTLSRSQGSANTAPASQPPPALAPPPPPSTNPPPPPPPAAGRSATGGEQASAPSAAAGPSTIQSTNPRLHSQLQDFRSRVGSFGVRVDEGDEDLSVQKMNGTIRDMITDLRTSTMRPQAITTEPTTMSREQLQQAIQKQLDAVKKVASLIQENSTIVDSLIKAANL